QKRVLARFPARNPGPELPLGGLALASDTLGRGAQRAQNTNRVGEPGAAGLYYPRNLLSCCFRQLSMNLSSSLFRFSCVPFISCSPFVCWAAFWEDPYCKCIARHT